MRRQAIFFLVDSQGVNAVGCYAGRPALGTPHLDRLAAQGVRFTRAYTTSPVCGPARSALFTGLYPHSNGVLGNNQAPQRCFPTLGERLQRHGVHTGYIGKWHLDGTDYFGSGRCPPGWDATYWFDGRNYLESLSDTAARDLSRRELSPADVARLGITAGFTHAHRSADRAIEFIRRHRDEDFLLVVSIDEPHHPYICPEPFVSAFRNFTLPLGPAARDTLADKPQQQRDWSRHVEPVRAKHVREGASGAEFHHPAYFGCNSFSDYEVGRVLAAIDAETPGALVTYTADHGEMCGAHRLMSKGAAMYDEIVHVPLLVRWPEHAAMGALAPHLVSHIDLTPTFLDFFGVTIAPTLQGTSLLPAVREPTRRLHDAVFLEFNRYEVDHDGFGAFAPIRCVLDERHKLAVNLLDTTDEFYDREVDATETKNLIADFAPAPARDRLHDALLEWMGVTRDPLRGPAWARRPWRDASVSTWGGLTRPRRFDPDYLPNTLLYATGREVDRWSYENG